MKNEKSGAVLLASLLCYSKYAPYPKCVLCTVWLSAFCVVRTVPALRRGHVRLRLHTGCYLERVSTVVVLTSASNEEPLNRD